MANGERPGCELRDCAVCRIRESFNEDEYERKIPCDLLVRLERKYKISMQ